MAVGDLWHSNIAASSNGSIQPSGSVEVVIIHADIGFKNSSNYSYAYFSGSSASGYNYVNAQGEDNGYKRSPKAYPAYHTQGMTKIPIDNSIYVYVISTGSYNGAWFGGVVTK